MKKFFAIMCTIMLIAGLMAQSAGAAVYEPIELTSEEAGAVNLFLSNFTEIGMDRCGTYGNDMDLVDFAHDHMWFNNYDEFEYGEYANENNCRVSDDKIQDIINRYFYDPYEVDLSQTRFDYVDGYYYHQETGGWISDGFAHTISCVPMGDGVYYVSFLIYAGGYAWDNSWMSASQDSIEAEYGRPNGFGCALVYAEDLSDRSTYRMISYSRV